MEEAAPADHVNGAASIDAAPAPIPAVPDFEAVRLGGLGVALYSIVPGEPVTLEIHAQGQVYTFMAESAEAAFALAFPPQLPKSIFD